LKESQSLLYHNGHLAENLLLNSEAAEVFLRQFLVLSHIYDIRQRKGDSFLNSSILRRYVTLEEVGKSTIEHWLLKFPWCHSLF